MGSIRYNHPYNGNYYSLSVTIREGYYYNKPFTFNAGVAKSLADWTSIILSMWAFSANPFAVATAAVNFFSASGILSKALNGAYTALITRTVTCTYSNQEYTGTATAPSTNYPQGFLVGTYAVVNNNGQTQIIREGFTDWLDLTFGRHMLNQIFGIDELPTSWYY